MKTSIKKMKLADLIPTENNPRQIKKDDFERLRKSVESFPQMLDIREIVVDENNRILGGHQRVKALLANGEKEVNVKVVEGLSEEEKREFVIRDNIQNGEWDFDVLANEWDDLPLDDWGILEAKNFEDNFGTDFALDDSEKSPFQTMSFTLSNEQAETIRDAMRQIGDNTPETFGNSNQHGNQLYEVVRQWQAQKK